MLYGREGQKDDFAEYYVEMCMEIVQQLVGNLQLVEKVELWGGLDLKKRMFESVAKLENFEMDRFQG
jgi:hypothetical protein